MELILAILALVVLCLLAAPMVIGLLLRVIAFAACLIGALLLRGCVAKAILLLFPLNPVVAEIIAVALLYLAMWSVLRTCIRKVRSAAPLGGWPAG